MQTAMTEALETYGLSPDTFEAMLLASRSQNSHQFMEDFGTEQTMKYLQVIAFMSGYNLWRKEYFKKVVMQEK